tara:strand:- start:490 stop:903 length:414 start_codon:yes stop_codon:yes gene_type:complete
MKINKRYLNWKDVEDLIDILHSNILESDFKIEYIYGIPRGGLIPSVLLSHKMGIPLTNYAYTKNSLIVDDICDSGKTLSEILAPNPTAVLHYKPHTSSFKPTLFASKFNDDDWIVYPWERVDSKTIQDYNIKLGLSK